MNQYQQFFLYNNYLQKLAYKNMFTDNSDKKESKQPTENKKIVTPEVKKIHSELVKNHHTNVTCQDSSSKLHPKSSLALPSQSQSENSHHPDKSKKLNDSVPTKNIEHNYLKDYDMVRHKNNELYLKLSNLKTKEEILKYLASLKDIHHFTSIHTNSDKVSIVEGFIVKKICLNNSLGNYMFWNEINALTKLRGYPHFPHLIAYDPNSLIIYMTYCGNLLSSDNLPNNWKEQIHEIKEILNGLNINSNDMLLRNTCCFDGEIKIIDFGLHTIFGRTIDEVIADLYNNINILSSSTNKVNPNIKYKYIEEYPNWRNNLEKYKNKQLIIQKTQENIKKYIKQQIYIKKK